MRLRGAGVHWRRVDDEVVLLDGTRYLTVNAAGAELWPLLEAGAEREALVDRLVAAFGLERDCAGEDVDRFVRQLSELGLLG